MSFKYPSDEKVAEKVAEKDTPDFLNNYFATIAYELCGNSRGMEVEWK